MIQVRSLAMDEIPLVVGIDVTEDGDTVLEQRGLTIVSRAEAWRRPPRDAARWHEFEIRWRAFVPDSGVALGAFVGDRLVGIAILRHAIRPALDQLDALFVDRSHRRLGVASALLDAAETLARAKGARQVYVSAAPSESAVGFYLRRGFTPTDEPIPELLALEPEDIQMVLTLRQPGGRTA